MNITKATILFFSLFSLTLSAQPVNWQIIEQDFQTGDTVYAEFRAYNFTGIGAFQFCFKVDTAKADFLLVESFNAPEQEEKLPEGVKPVYTETQKQFLLSADTSGGKTPENSLVVFSPLEFTGSVPGLDNGDFSWHSKPGYNLPAGQLRSVWSNPYGSTVADGLIIFKIRLKAKQAGSLSQTLNLWPNHFLKPSCYKAIPLTWLGYMPFVYVAESQEETTATVEPPNRVFISASPNPVSETLFLGINLAQSEKILVNLYDANGYAVFGQRYEHPGGQQGFKVEMPTTPGMYLLTVQSSDGVTAKKIVKN